MAKYKVEQFAQVIKDNGKGYDNLYLSLTLQNSAGNPASREYRIAPDTRWPDLAALTNTIVAGLALAQQTGAWIELSDFEERVYLFLVLPSNAGKENIQVTAEKL
ncbi:hypothetical protein [Pseudomonas viridiflava]|uniref:hypothetical protein n=1 Tax=Pseudomonas viridiflava TaxID=33069 RepID=UPI0013CE76E0|nr:hypothetical protein [Pseudomonas viridiflava]